MDPQLTSALIGGSLALAGAMLTQAYQHWAQRRNVRQAISVEIRTTLDVLSRLVVARRALRNGSLDEVDCSDLYQSEDEIIDWRISDPFDLILRAKEDIETTDFFQIYDANTDKFGRLSPTQTEKLIEYHSETQEVFRRLEELSETEIYTEMANHQGGEEEVDNIDLLMVLNHATRAYDSGSDARFHLFSSAILMKTLDTLIESFVSLYIKAKAYLQ